jgi:ubiquinone/menaquinone biosynthesis C-methylase UbiE
MSIRKKMFAWALCNSDETNHKIYGSYKDKLLSGLYGQVVEFGPGSGINFRYLSRNILWTGIEPNEAFHKNLLLKAQERGIMARLISNAGKKIPLPDNHADFILCTLVLCSVENPREVVNEMKRILKPGGRLIFIEHVAAPRKSQLRLLQNLVNPLNRFMADGCNCNRETWQFIQNGQFTFEEITHHRVKGTLPFHRPHIMGIAVKQGQAVFAS